jgi:hypothetical protein
MHLRSLYSRYSLMALGRLSLSSAPCSMRGRPICCRVTRRHRSIKGSGSAAQENRWSREDKKKARKKKKISQEKIA